MLTENPSWGFFGVSTVSCVPLAGHSHYFDRAPLADCWPESLMLTMMLHFHCLSWDAVDCDSYCLDLWWPEAAYWKCSMSTWCTRRRRLRCRRWWNLNCVHCSFRRACCCWWQHCWCHCNTSLRDYFHSRNSLNCHCCNASEWAQVWWCWGTMTMMTRRDSLRLVARLGSHDHTHRSLRWAELAVASSDWSHYRRWSNWTFFRVCDATFHNCSTRSDSEESFCLHAGFASRSDSADCSCWT